MDYREAGVDVEKGRAFVQRLHDMVASTHRPGVMGKIGGFGGLFELPAGYQRPVLVSGTDGVGTKLKLAQQTNQHQTVGIDLVAMCVNDVLTLGAEPLFFLDYIATGVLDSDQLADVVSGIAAGCRQAGCALLGGETAEMPGFYTPGEYDLAGFCVGIVEADQLRDGSQVQVGDVAIALASSGVHSNGYSLIRKIIAESPYGSQPGGGFQWSDRIPTLGDQSLGELLLTPTQIYVKPVLAALRSGLDIHGMVHVTGGGWTENIPRGLGADQSLQLDLSNWSIPTLFEWLAAMGDISLPEMFNTFNMGVGFVLFIEANQADQALAWFQQQQVAAFPLGEVVAGTGQVLGLPT